MRFSQFAPVRHVRARPRLWAAFAVGTATALLLRVTQAATWADHGLTRALIGWNVGALLYLTLAFIMMWRSSTEKMHWRARLEDEGRYTILVVVIVATVALLVAIAAQLVLARSAHGAEKISYVVLCGLTILTTWLFTQTMFALHYAHEYQLQLSHHSNESPAFTFPGTDAPDYFDFLYVACIIGTSGQTADVAFSSRRSRRVGLMHCVLAFFFNTTLLALTINVAAGLI